MALRVELCGRLADSGGPALTLELPAGGCTVAQLRALVAAACPALADDMANTRIRACVEEAIVGDDAWVMPGQLVAFFPPLSGGRA